QQDAFNKLGIAYQNADGSLRDGREVLLDFADAFQQFGNSPELLASGMQVFGRSFQNLIPLLANGREGLQAAADEADRLGITLSGEAGRQAEEFNDNLTRLTTVVHGFWQGIAADLLPDLVKLSQDLLGTATNADKLGESTRRAADGIRTLASGIGYIAKTFKLIGESIASAMALADSFHDTLMGIATLDLSRIREGLSLGLITAEGYGEAMGVGQPRPQQGPPQVRIHGRDDAPDSMFRRSENEVRMEEFRKRQQEYARLAEEQRAAAEAAAAGSRARADAERAAAEAMAESNRAGEEPNRAMMESERRQLEWMTRIEDATALMEGPAAQAVLTLKRSIAEADAALAAGTITIAQHSDYLAAMGHQYGETLAQVDVASGEMSTIADQAARNMQDAFADFLFDPFQDGLSGMVESFAETLRRLAAQAAASKIFEAIGTWAGSYSGAGSGWINAVGSILDGRRASGGPVYPGGTFLVGENGPEVLRMGNNSGTIVPNNRLPSLGNGAVSVKVEMINQGGQVETQSQTAQRMPDGTVLVRLVNQVVNQGIARGDYNAAMGHAFGLQRRPIPQG